MKRILLLGALALVLATCDSAGRLLIDAGTAISIDAGAQTPATIQWQTWEGECPGSVGWPGLDPSKVAVFFASECDEPCNVRRPIPISIAANVVSLECQLNPGSGATARIAVGLLP